MVILEGNKKNSPEVIAALIVLVGVIISVSISLIIGLCKTDITTDNYMSKRLPSTAWSG